MNFGRVSLSSLIEVLEAITWNMPCSIKDIIAFTGFSRTTVNNALKISISLDLVNESENLYKIVEEYDKNLSLNDKKVIITKHLQNLKLFQVLCGFLQSSTVHVDAIRKTLVFCKIDHKYSDSVKNVLLLAVDLNLITFDGTNYSISESIAHPPHELEIDEVQLNSEIAVRLFLSKRLSPELFHSLENPEKDRLTLAFLHYKSDPERSCEHSGQSLENYLRYIGVKEGVDLTSCDGIGQIADYLSGKGRLIIHPRHRDIAKSISSIRNSSAHDRDKLTSDPWIKTSEIALANALLVIQLIKSIHGWVTSKAQIL
ncbi:hypothetical protein [Cohnella caldifontis]|uniref:hypothetical protein n=1 Tax=Cohnella caldifontis TaxID=3027471 RepID=UPI0023EB18F8|nr:hypothetical protein [Cohnella sp. YIM B05605]